jgi:hypothetical protein
MVLWVSVWASSGFDSFSLCRDQRTAAHYTSEKERTLAADAMKTAITGTLTATSIILAACAAALGLYQNRSQLQNALSHFRSAAEFGIASILLAAINLAFLPAQVNTVNVASSWFFNLLGFLQLVFMVFSAVRLMLAIKNIF